jgi:hypothetical protein
MADAPCGKVGQTIAFCGLPVRGAKGRRLKPTACPTGPGCNSYFATMP